MCTNNLINVNNPQLRVFYCFDNGISKYLIFLYLITTSPAITGGNANAMNSFPRHNRKIMVEDTKVHVWKGGEKASILEREQNRITLSERRGKRGRKARHKVLWALARVGKHYISAIKHAELEGIFSYCQDGR